jgi:tripartite-type tricarboxylate transporter receptor subunit TctC
MPRDVVRKLNESITAILHSETFQTQIAPEGAVVAPMEPEALKAFMAAEYAKHGSLVARSGATIQ